MSVDIIASILSHLEVHEIIHFSRVNKEWKQAVENVLRGYGNVTFEQVNAEKGKITIFQKNSEVVVLELIISYNKMTPKFIRELLKAQSEMIYERLEPSKINQLDFPTTHTTYLYGDSSTPYGIKVFVQSLHNYKLFLKGTTYVIDQYVAMKIMGFLQLHFKNNMWEMVENEYIAVCGAMRQNFDDITRRLGNRKLEFEVRISIDYILTAIQAHFDLMREKMNILHMILMDFCKLVMCLEDQKKIKRIKKAAFKIFTDKNSEANNEIIDDWLRDDMKFLPKNIDVVAENGKIIPSICNLYGGDVSFSKMNKLICTFMFILRECINELMEKVGFEPWYGNDFMMGFIVINDMVELGIIKHLLRKYPMNYSLLRYEGKYQIQLLFNNWADIEVITRFFDVDNHNDMEHDSDGTPLGAKKFNTMEEFADAMKIEK
jgi:hypothetical protein